MTATVKTPSGDLTIDHQVIASIDQPLYELARAYIARNFPTGIDTSDPEPDWTLAQALASELDGLAVPGPPIEYTQDDQGRVY